MKQLINTLALLILTTSFCAFGMDTTEGIKRIILDPAIKEKIRLAMIQSKTVQQTNSAIPSQKTKNEELEAALPVLPEIMGHMVFKYLELPASPRLAESADSESEASQDEYENEKSEQALLAPPKAVAIALSQENLAQIEKLKKERTAEKKRQKRLKKREKMRTLKLSQEQLALEEKLEPVDQFWAALEANELVKAESLIIAHKVPLNCRHKTLNYTPLHHGAGNDNPELITLLLKYGAKPNEFALMVRPSDQAQIKTTPLFVAVSMGNLIALKKLLEKQAHPDLGAVCLDTGDFLYPLCSAADVKDTDQDDDSSHCQREMVKLLLQHGATKFIGKIVFLDHGSKAGQVLIPSKQLDKMLIQTFLRRNNAIDCIVCHKGNIFLLGDPTVNYKNSDYGASESENEMSDSTDDDAELINELNNLSISSDTSNNKEEEEIVEDSDTQLNQQQISEFQTEQQLGNKDLN